MATLNTPPQALDDQQLADIVKAFKRDYPGVSEAMRTFEVSDEAYQATLNALYGPRVSWTSTANDTLVRRK